jgi:hypothetical protein
MKKINPHHFRKSGYSFVIVIFILLLNFGFPEITFSFERDTLKLTTPPQITINAEYDNNFYLVSRQDERYKSDYLVHICPKFALSRPYKNHNFGLSLESDLRKGIITVPWQLNLQSTGLINLKFNNGLELGINDSYTMSDFDLGLTDYPGILNVSPLL